MMDDYTRNRSALIRIIRKIRSCVVVVTSARDQQPKRTRRTESACSTIRREQMHICRRNRYGNALADLGQRIARHRDEQPVRPRVEVDVAGAAESLDQKDPAGNLPLAADARTVRPNHYSHVLGTDAKGARR